MANIYKKEGSKMTFKFPYDKNIVEELKRIDFKERTWDPIGKVWIIRLSLNNLSIVNEIIKQFGFEPSNEDLKEDNEEKNINTYIKSKSRLNLLKSYKKEIEKLNETSLITPYEYQEEGIDYMCSWDFMINGDDMGLGKSIQTIYSAEIKDRFPCLLVCPSSTKYQWKELWLKINKDRNISIIEAQKQNDWNADVIIINYDILGKTEKEVVDEEEVKNFKIKFKELKKIIWKYIVFDEIHFLKNSKSRRSKISKEISKDVECIHGLTGTLSENKPSDIINQLSLIKQFYQLFGTWDNFVNRYCDAKPIEIRVRGGENKAIVDYSGSSNSIELNRLLRETCYIRREKREVLKDLPPIQKSILNMDIDNMEDYRLAEDDFIDFLTNNYRDRVDSAIMAEFLVKRNFLRILSTHGKIKSIIKWLEDFSEQSNEKMLVVGNFTKPLELLSIHFDAEVLDGSLSAQEKRETIKRWNKNKKQFLFANIKAVGTGTDGLQDKCSYMAVIDLPDKPSTIDQLVSRLERIGQKNAIFIYNLLNNYTIDMILWEAIEAKREVTEAVNKGLKYDSQVDINNIIADSYLKRL